MPLSTQCQEAGLRCMHSLRRPTHRWKPHARAPRTMSCSISSSDSASWLSEVGIMSAAARRCSMRRPLARVSPAGRGAGGGAAAAGGGLLMIEAPSTSGPPPSGATCCQLGDERRCAIDHAPMLPPLLLRLLLRLLLMLPPL